MKDYYKYTRQAIDRYDNIMEDIKTKTTEIDEESEEFVMNFCLHLAHALIKDTGSGQLAREELGKVADIINDVIM